MYSVWSCSFYLQSRRHRCRCRRQQHQLMRCAHRRSHSMWSLLSLIVASSFVSSILYHHWNETENLLPQMNMTMIASHVYWRKKNQNCTQFHFVIAFKCAWCWSKVNKVNIVVASHLPSLNDDALSSRLPSLPLLWTQCCFYSPHRSLTRTAVNVF